MPVNKETGEPHRARADVRASIEANTRVARTALITAKMRTVIDGLPPIVTRI